MSNYVTLMGSEDVARAGRTIAGAAEDMVRAASTIDSAVYNMQRINEEFLTRLDDILHQDREARKTL